MAETYIEETPVKRRWAAALADALRGARDVANNAAVPESVPMVGGLKLGDMVLGKAHAGLVGAKGNEDLSRAVVNEARSAAISALRKKKETKEDEDK